MITDNYNANNYDTDRNYDPVDDVFKISDPPSATPNKNSTDDDSIDYLDDEYAAIILKPAGFDHHGFISGV